MRDVSTRWFIGVDAWIIQDGNYGEFTVGDRAEFAIEFDLPGEFEVVDGQPVGARWLTENEYQVVAQVMHLDDRAWVIDFGLGAYRDSKPPDGLSVGDLIRGRISLGIDPFMYFEALANRREYPDLIYSWDVREILRETAPFIRTDGVWIRDDAKRSRMAVERTDAWQDDDGHADYLLHCDLVDLPPKRQSATACS